MKRSAEPPSSRVGWSRAPTQRRTGWVPPEPRQGRLLQLQGSERHGMVLPGRTWSAPGGESFAKWSYLLRCFADLLTCSKVFIFTTQLNSPKPLRHRKLLARALRCVLSEMQEGSAKFQNQVL